MQNLILFVSLMGVVNSLIIIFYLLYTKKGNRTTNILFSLLVFVLTVRISKSILLTFSDGLHDFLLTAGLSGFLAIGPVYFLLVKSISQKNFLLNYKQGLHLLPAILFLGVWVSLDHIRGDYLTWNFTYLLIMLQYISYIIAAQLELKSIDKSKNHIRAQLNIMTIILLGIWFVYYLNAVTHFFPYIGGALLYSVIIYFSITMILNKGNILNLHTSKKYEKTGLDDTKSKELIASLTKLFEDEQLYTDNTISLSKLAKRLNTSSHQLSQAINSEKEMTYFELLAEYRINAAKEMIANPRNNEKIESIAYMAGYNSISAFNTAFKKQTGLTPTQFKNGK